MIAAVRFYSALGFNRDHFENMTLLEASGFLGRQQQSLAEAQYSKKFKLKFVRILVSHPVHEEFIAKYLFIK